LLRGLEDFDSLTASDPSSTIFKVELAFIIVIVALFVVGSLVPRIDMRPWQGGFVLFADTKEAIKVIYRIWATWRIELLNHKREVLTQHFEVFKGDAPHYQFRKMP
jgi:hypothetical protein